MTSKQSDENTENCSTAIQLESLNIDARLAALDCPFNWNLYDASAIEAEELSVKRGGEFYESWITDRQDYFPEYEIIYLLNYAFEAAILKKLPSAMECVNEAEQTFADIKEKGILKNVEKVLQHLILGSKCHLLKELGRLTEVDQLLKEICDIDDMNETELAMLNGCHCLAFTLYNTVDCEGKIYAAAAIKHDPNNGKWHFLLGENYRALRRKQFWPSQQPSEEETSAFQDAYRLSPNVLFGVSLAQLYRESWNYTMANKIYKEVHALQPTNCTVRLQLALGFIRVHECALAKECLDYVAEQIPDNNRYAHYMGIYEEKCNKNLEAALPYYKKTTESLNWCAEWQYIECRRKVESDWDPLPYLLDLLEKYEDFPHRVNQLNMQIGSYYLFDLHDILSACKYLTEVIEIQPFTKRLRDHSLLFRPFERVNIYYVLAKEIEFALKIGATKYDNDEISVLKNTLELCHKNCLDLSAPPEISRPRFPSSQRSRGCRNDERSSSSSAVINWREEKPSSSFRGSSTNQNQRWGSDGPNSPKRLSGSPNQRDYTFWRSDKPATQNNTFKVKEDSAFTDRLKGRGFREVTISPQRNKNEDGEASCNLVKTVKDLNL